ncbi:MAG: hypothetical protein JSS49_05525 [Planctomycetes bacterium]|nr:hypothetical protein [Planctomycetota bacterium]
MNPVVPRPRSLVVPRQHESVLAVPAYTDLVALAHANYHRLASTKLDFHGVSLQALREQSQREILHEAANYTRPFAGEFVPSPGQYPLIVTGHQPELFHAGVWAKNFAVSGLARRTRGQGLNLIIDNDTITSTRIQIPVGSRESPTLEMLPFDASQPQQPWEDAVIAERTCFQSFGQQIQSRIRHSWNYTPLATAAWPSAVRHADVSLRLCDCLTAARVAIEQKLGIRNLEVPMSRVCGTKSFCLFAAYLLVNLANFQRIYNEAVRQYRTAHRLRSSTHPVPELDGDGEWMEAPFWAWRHGDQRRERPFARQAGSVLEIRDSRGVFVRLPVTPSSGLDAAAETLVQLNRAGIRLRTRALTTTLFSRLFLADLFIHGIGGAKYDAMTDQICEQFFGIAAPPFGTVSATVHLPLGTPFPVSLANWRDTNQRIRDLRYNPEKYLPESVEQRSSELRSEKAAILAGLGAGRPSSPQHRRLSDINAELFQQLDSAGRDLEIVREQMRRQLQINSILQNRDFSWCLHAEDRLISFFGREFPESMALL